MKVVIDKEEFRVYFFAGSPRGGFIVIDGDIVHLDSIPGKFYIKPKKASAKRNTGKVVARVKFLTLSSIEKCWLTENKMYDLMRRNDGRVYIVDKDGDSLWAIFGSALPSTKYVIYDKKG